MLKLLKKRIKDQRGLTLIELLAVVVILGIIAAIAVPSIGKIIDNTKKDAVVAEGIQIISAAKLYASSEKLTFSSNNAEITKANLGSYLENIQDTGAFKVIVYNSNGSYTYTLETHGSVTLVDSTANGGNNDSKASESELLKYKK